MIYEEFEERMKKNKKPPKPRSPEKTVSKKDFVTDEEYHLHLANVLYPQFRKDMVQYEADKEDYELEVKAIWSVFYNALINEYAYAYNGAMHESRVRHVFNKALEESKSGGLHSIEQNFEEYYDFAESYRNL